MGTRKGEIDAEKRGRTERKSRRKDGWQLQDDDDEDGRHHAQAGTKKGLLSSAQLTERGATSYCLVVMCFFLGRSNDVSFFRSKGT